MRWPIAAVVLAASVAHAAPAGYDCDAFPLCDDAVMTPGQLAACKVRKERDRCVARAENAVTHVLAAARAECKRPGAALTTLVETIHSTGVGPHVIDGWDKLTAAERDAFDALVEPLADQLLDGANDRTDAIAIVCDPRVIWKPSYDTDGTVRVWGSYKPGTEHLVDHVYVMLYFERARRAGESWTHYELAPDRHAQPQGADDRRWHYNGGIENGMVQEHRPPPYQRLRDKLGGGDYARAMAALRAQP